MRLIAFLPIALLAVVGASSDCGGETFTTGGVDGSAEGGRGSSGDGSTGSSSSGSGGSSSGAGSSSSSGGSSSSSGGSSSGSSGGGKDAGSQDAGGGGCAAPCGVGRLCCNGACVNTANNPDHCGGCDVTCGAGTYCNGSCQPIPCSSGQGNCRGGTTCCGSSCCTPGQICCQQEGPVGGIGPTCYTPTASQPTCAPGCAPLCVSDRNVKRDIEAIDEQAVLESVARMPISTWSYTTDDPSVRHLGPMAQDFHASFRLGDTDRAYDPIDAHGVAFAAIKALRAQMLEQNARIERLERENSELRSGGACSSRSH